MPALDQSALKLAAATLVNACELLNECINTVGKKLREAKDGKYDERMASHLAFLTKNMTPAFEALRKFEKDKKYLLDHMTADERDTLVGDYLASLPKERRSEFLRWLQEYDSGGGGFTP